MRADHALVRAKPISRHFNDNFGCIHSANKRYCLFVWRTIAVGPFTTNFLRPLSFSEPHCWQTPRRPRLTTYTRRKNFLAEPSFRVLRQPYSCFERTSVSGTGEELHPTRPGNSVASQNSSKIIDNAAETSDGNAEEELIDVEFRDVVLQYGESRVLDGINLRIRRGESVAIIGPSGTGKSTLLRLVCGLEIPSAGEVLIRGRARKKRIQDERNFNAPTKVAMVFQNAALFDSMTVMENVSFPLTEKSVLPAEKIFELAKSSLALVGLNDDVFDLYPHQLSGGMQKRVSLARATIFDPDDASGPCRASDILLLDEPTTGLDPMVSTQIENVVRNCRRVCPTCIVVTHQYSTIRRTADRVVFVHKGKVQWDGSVQDAESTSNPYMRQFYSASLEGPIRVAGHSFEVCEYSEERS